jgi:hypothetical protein
MSKVKQEILNRELNGEEIEFLGDNWGNIHDAMNEYAKQEAIEFAVFCAKKVLGVFPTDVKESEWYYQDKTGRYNKTTEQLYELFLQMKGK